MPLPSKQIQFVQRNPLRSAGLLVPVLFAGQLLFFT